VSRRWKEEEKEEKREREREREMSGAHNEEFYTFLARALTGPALRASLGQTSEAHKIRYSQSDEIIMGLETIDRCLPERLM
jgi:hypothetical protein